MFQIIQFIQRRSHFFVFLILEIVAVALIIRSYYTHTIYFLNSANYISGSLYSAENNFSKYLTLDSENQKLLEENTVLKNKISILENINASSGSAIQIVDSTQFQRYKYIPARIISNTVSKKNNYLSINKGRRDQITQDMAVITDKGVIGITDFTTNKFTRVMSLLNENTRINSNIKNKGVFGTVEWNGVDYRYVQLRDIPKHLKIEINDTVVTDIRSNIFPSGIPIGIIKDFKLEEGTDEYVANVELFEDFVKVENVYVVTDFDKIETDSLHVRP
ncbi:MAG: rod shape-determining protein MreC [Flavobacteriales bacterium]